MSNYLAPFVFVFHFNMPAQSLQASIWQVCDVWWHQFHYACTYNPDEINGFDAPPVRGDLTINQVLRQLLVNTPFDWDFLAPCRIRSRDLALNSSIESCTREGDDWKFTMLFVGRYECRPEDLELYALPPCIPRKKL